LNKKGVSEKHETCPGETGGDGDWQPLSLRGGKVAARDGGNKIFKKRKKGRIPQVGGRVIDQPWSKT